MSDVFSPNSGNLVNYTVELTNAPVQTSYDNLTDDPMSTAFTTKNTTTVYYSIEPANDEKEYDKVETYSNIYIKTPII